MQLAWTTEETNKHYSIPNFFSCKKFALFLLYDSCSRSHELQCTFKVLCTKPGVRWLFATCKKNFFLFMRCSPKLQRMLNNNIQALNFSAIRNLVNFFYMTHVHVHTNYWTVLMYNIPNQLKATFLLPVQIPNLLSLCAVGLNYKRR